MNTRFTLVSVLAGLLLLFSGCSKDYNNDPQGIIPVEAVAQAFSEKYPDATGISFEIDGNYYLAQFMNGTASSEAWFTDQGKWMMEKTELPYSQLPSAVTTAFKASAYGNWQVDESDQISREGMGTIYKIEVDKSGTETDLYYTAYGSLMMVTDNGNNDDVPIVIPGEVTDLMNLTFAGLQLLYIQPNTQGYQLDMLDKQVYKTAQLNKDYRWQYTTWQITPQEVPAVVMQAFQQSAYANDEVISINTLINAGGTFQLFQVIHNGQQTTVSFDVAGNIVNT